MTKITSNHHAAFALDFKVNSATPMPAVLRPGETAELWYEIQAPDQINLSCEYNHTAFGHWSALYRRSDRAHLAHRPVKIVLVPPPQALDQQKSQ
jgi:hypothetical protein